MIRLRFAPSPTGYLHIGNARTALFNYLLARQDPEGVLVLRIEDTDMKRSLPEYEAGIIEDLSWLGIEWDEGPDRGGPHGPYRQSERMERYRAAVQKLIADGHAYHCYCTTEEIEQLRREQSARRESPRYDNRCRELSRARANELAAGGRVPVVRFRMPEKKLVFEDLIRGPITFDTALMGDLVIMRQDGFPSFHLAVVCDDIEMAITHVVRGEDHISNTPRHILLFEALGHRPPLFAHMAMTLGPDGSRLSKRHGAASVRELRAQGFLPEAVFNYLALLGWGTTDDRDIYTPAELIEKFSLERCKQGSAVFDMAKLTWLNSVYLQKKAPEEIASLARPFLVEAGLLAPGETPGETARLVEIVKALGDRARKLSELPEASDYFFREPGPPDPETVKKVIRRPDTLEILEKMRETLLGCDDFSPAGLEKAIREFCEAGGIKTSHLFHPLRVAVSGRTVGPGLFETLSLVGKERTVARIAGFIALCRKG